MTPGNAQGLNEVLWGFLFVYLKKFEGHIHGAQGLFLAQCSGYHMGAVGR